MNVGLLIDRSIKSLIHLSENPHLEAQLLLSEILKVSRAYLYTYPERLLTFQEQERFQDLLARRVTGEPLAYILGRKAFWSFELKLSPVTLIPRPETELLVELALSLLPTDIKLWIADLGTGSGAIAIALALERPSWQVAATDISRGALEMAQLNAAALNCPHINFYQGAWCAALPKRKYDLIVSNPPYIAFDDSRIEPNVAKFEPYSALFAQEEGLGDIRQIVSEAKLYLAEGGFLLLEHGAYQADAVVALLVKNHYTHISTHLDLSGKPRVTLGRQLTIG